MGTKQPALGCTVSTCSRAAPRCQTPARLQLRGTIHCTTSSSQAPPAWPLFDLAGPLLPAPRYMPVLPTVLVNGAEGIGTGWSTSIPNFNPRDVAANLRCMLDGEQPEPMKPWYRGFKGTIEEVGGRLWTLHTRVLPGTQAANMCGPQALGTRVHSELGRPLLGAGCCLPVCHVPAKCCAAARPRRAATRPAVPEILIACTARPGTCAQVPTKTTGKSYQICGVISQLDDTTLEISELPIRKWTQVCGGACTSGGGEGCSPPVSPGRLMLACSVQLSGLQKWLMTGSSWPDMQAAL